MEALTDVLVAEAYCSSDVSRLVRNAAPGEVMAEAVDEVLLEADELLAADVASDPWESQGLACELHSARRMPPP